jgi:hypothetical protein
MTVQNALDHGLALSLCRLIGSDKRRLRGDTLRRARGGTRNSQLEIRGSK